MLLNPVYSCCRCFCFFSVLTCAPCPGLALCLVSNRTAANYPCLLCMCRSHCPDKWGASAFALRPMPALGIDRKIWGLPEWQWLFVSEPHSSPPFIIMFQIKVTLRQPFTPAKMSRSHVARCFRRHCSSYPGLRHLRFSPAAKDLPIRMDSTYLVTGFPHSPTNILFGRDTLGPSVLKTLKIAYKRNALL